MSENNVKTSDITDTVVRQQSDMYKVDLNNLNLSENYEINQIFSGNNVTVYALLESSDEINGDNLKKILNNNKSRC